MSIGASRKGKSGWNEQSNESGMVIELVEIWYPARRYITPEFDENHIEISNREQKKNYMLKK